MSLLSSLVAAIAKYNDDQDRDEHGRWSGASGGADKATDKAQQHEMRNPHDHATAAELHREAATAHRQASAAIAHRDERRAAYHDASARNHVRAAGMHKQLIG